MSCGDYCHLMSRKISFHSFHSVVWEARGFKLWLIVNLVITVKILKIQTPQKIAVIILTFDEHEFSMV